MAEKRNTNANISSDWDRNPSRWDGESEIGMWNPNSSTNTEWSTAADQGVRSSTNNTGWSTAAGQRVETYSTTDAYNSTTPATDMYTQAIAAHLSGANNDWSNQMPPYDYSASQSTTHGPQSTNYTNNGAQNTNFPTQGYAPSPRDPYYQQAQPNYGTNYQSPQQFNNTQEPYRNTSQDNYDTWSSTTSWNPPQENRVSEYNQPPASYNQPPASYNQTPAAYNQHPASYNPKTFKNPLLENDGDSCDNTEKLIEQLHIQDKTALKQLPDNTPRVISKSSLAMLKHDLNQAGLPFQSAENLKLARDAHLGFDISDETLGSKVVFSNLSAEAVGFVPRTSHKLPEIQCATKEQGENVVRNLGIFIDNVLTQPGDFDTLASPLVDEVKSCIHSDDTVKTMVDIIFRKAIDEDNFKYLGAKLCHQLTQPNFLKPFRRIFLAHLQKEYSSTTKLIENCSVNDLKTIHGFFMFLAEVFIHIKINGAPIKALGRSLNKSISSMLEEKSHQIHVQFVCKVLKLSGGFLLDAFCESEEDLKYYDEVFQALSKIQEEIQSKSDEENKRLTLLIKSVLNIRDNNWGRTKSTTQRLESIDDPEQFGEDLSLVDQNYYMNEPVFFTPEGVQYTAAEAQIPDFYDQHLAKYQISQFTEDNQDNNLNFNDNTADDLVPSDEEYELYKQDREDYNDEYEKFLQESGQL